MSLDKVKQGLPPHRMSLLVDIEYGRPFEVEVSVCPGPDDLPSRHGLVGRRMR